MNKEQRLAILMVQNPRFDDNERINAKNLFSRYFHELDPDFNPIEFDDYCDGRINIEEETLENVCPNFILGKDCDCSYCVED